MKNKKNSSHASILFVPRNNLLTFYLYFIFFLFFGRLFYLSNFPFLERHSRQKVRWWIHGPPKFPALSFHSKRCVSQARDAAFANICTLVCFVLVFLNHLMRIADILTSTVDESDGDDHFSMISTPRAEGRGRKVHCAFRRLIHSCRLPLLNLSKKSGKEKEHDRTAVVKISASGLDAGALSPASSVPLSGVSGNSWTMFFVLLFETLNCFLFSRENDVLVSILEVFV